MPNKLKKSGLLFAAVFAAGYVVQIVALIPRVGLLQSFYYGYQPLLLLSTLLFLASAFLEPLRWFQPLLFLALTPLSIISDARNIYGLGFYIMSVLLFERAGFFKSHRLLKAALLALYLLALETISVIFAHEVWTRAMSAVFFIFAFGVFLWFLYRDRIVVILKEPKPRLSLAERGLSPSERSYVQQTLQGKSQKEIAIDFELSESTVRNTLSNAYKKLGVEDRVGLAIMGERFEIAD